MEVGDHPVERLQRDGRRSTGKSQRRIDDGHRERQRGGEPGRIGDDDRSRVRAFLGERVLRALAGGGAAVIERPVEREPARTARAQAAARPGSRDAQLNRVALGSRRDRVHRDRGRSEVRQQGAQVDVLGRCAERDRVEGDRRQAEQVRQGERPDGEEVDVGQRWDVSDVRIPLDADAEALGNGAVDVARLVSHRVVHRRAGGNGARERRCLIPCLRRRREGEVGRRQDVAPILPGLHPRPDEDPCPLPNSRSSTRRRRLPPRSRWRRRGRG